MATYGLQQQWIYWVDHNLEGDEAWDEAHWQQWQQHQLEQQWLEEEIQWQQQD